MIIMIIIATLMVVTAVAVTVCVMQQKAIVLINQNKNLIVQMSEEKAKATKVLSEKEQELREAKERASRHLSDWNALYLEKKAAEAKKAASINMRSRGAVSGSPGKPQDIRSSLEAAYRQLQG